MDRREFILRNFLSVNFTESPEERCTRLSDYYDLIDNFCEDHTSTEPLTQNNADNSLLVKAGYTVVVWKRELSIIWLCTLDGKVVKGPYPFNTISPQSMEAMLLVLNNVWRVGRETEIKSQPPMNWSVKIPLGPTVNTPEGYHPPISIDIESKPRATYQDFASDVEKFIILARENVK